MRSVEGISGLQAGEEVNELKLSERSFRIRSLVGATGFPLLRCSRPIDPPSDSTTTPPGDGTTVKVEQVAA